MSNYVYAITGPPFNFLGTLSESQWKSFTTWVDAHTGAIPQVQTHHQIRALQLRKTSGLLEQFYSTMNDEPLTPTFQKEAWQPAATGHWAFAGRDDHAPAMIVNKIKNKFAHHLQRQDDALFHMTHLRAQIEKQEDMAQYAYEAPTDLPGLLSRIDSLFDQPEYQNTLVKDVSDQYQGQPRFRVHALDAPTAWEITQRNHIQT